MELWARRPRESARAYGAFVAYRDMGPSRSIDSAFAESRKSPGGVPRSGRWATWARENEWVARSQAYDDHIDLLRRQELAKAVKEQAKRMAERTVVTREEEWEVGDELTRKGRDLLASVENFFETRESFKPGKKGVIDKQGRLIEPPEPGERTITIALRAEAMLAALKLGFDLKTQAIGKDVPTEEDESAEKLPAPVGPMDALREMLDIIKVIHDDWDREQAAAAGVDGSGITEAQWTCGNDGIGRA